MTTVAKDMAAKVAAAQWVAGFKAKLTALCNEVKGALHAARPGSALAEAFDSANLQRMAEVEGVLDQADGLAAGLDVEGVEVPMPDLSAFAG